MTFNIVRSQLYTNTKPSISLPYQTFKSTLTEIKKKKCNKNVHQCLFIYTRKNGRSGTGRAKRVAGGDERDFKEEAYIKAKEP